MPKGSCRTGPFRRSWLKLRMADERYWRALLAGEKKGIGYDFVRALLAILAGTYSMGLAGYLFAERIGLRRRGRVPVPVISIGNLTVGGTGKTPMAQRMARHFQDAGRRVVILNRGYRGASESSEAVVSDTEGNVLLPAFEAGDEASVLAESLPGVPVIVGKDRRRSARIALERFQPDLMLLDDALQYWQLHRDLDIVLVDARRPFDNGYPLPRGLLREPKGNIRRAGVIVVTRSERIGAEERSSLLQELMRLAPNAPVFFARHSADGWRPVNKLAEGAEPGECLAVCAIAQPDSFFRSVAEAGIRIAGTLAYRDHGSYGPAEKAQITGKIRECGAKCVVTTEKDAVKMPDDYLDIAVFSLKTVVEIENECEFWKAVDKRAGFA